MGKSVRGWRQTNLHSLVEFGKELSDDSGLGGTDFRGDLVRLEGDNDLILFNKLSNSCKKHNPNESVKRDWARREKEEKKKKKNPCSRL